jgi:hypothetical protein
MPRAEHAVQPPLHTCRCPCCVIAGGGSQRCRLPQAWRPAAATHAAGAPSAAPAQFFLAPHACKLIFFGGAAVAWPACSPSSLPRAPCTGASTHTAFQPPWFSPYRPMGGGACPQPAERTCPCSYKASHHPSLFNAPFLPSFPPFADYGRPAAGRPNTLCYRFAVTLPRFPPPPAPRALNNE